MRVQLVGGPLDGDEIDAPVPLPARLLVPYLPWSHEGSPFGPGPGDADPDAVDVPVPDLLEYLRDPQLYTSGRMVRYRFR